VVEKIELRSRRGLAVAVLSRHNTIDRVEFLPIPATIEARMHRVEEILALFEKRGRNAYLGEPVSQAEHALQAAHLAVLDGASDALVVASLLHDVGHLLHDLGEDIATRGVDARHEVSGSSWLARNFGPEVAEPARLHVAAKRYLCATEPSYREGLSDASKLSLQLQGGPMTPEEVANFEANPHAVEAVRLRRWDDEAKIANLEVPGLETYLERIIAVLKEPTAQAVKV
jgi:phosphonate degradation associated HDIG domain protein